MRTRLKSPIHFRHLPPLVQLLKTTAQSILIERQLSLALMEDNLLFQLTALISLDISDPM